MEYFVCRVINDGIINYIDMINSFDRIIKSQNQYCFEDDNYKVEYIKINGLIAQKCLELYFVNLYKPLYNRDKKFHNELHLSIPELEQLDWITYTGPPLIKRKKYRQEPYMGYAYRNISDGEKSFVYKKIDSLNNEVVYVGSADISLDRRIDTHTLTHGGIAYRYEYLAFPSVADASFCELYFINRYQPKNNYKQKYDDTNPFILTELDNMTWTEYNKAEYLLQNPKKASEKPRKELIINWPAANSAT